MDRIRLLMGIAVTLAVGCHNVEALPPYDPLAESVKDLLAEGNMQVIRLTGLQGLDMLVVVDNSSSMDQEQGILAQGYFPLINSLVSPAPGWPHVPLSDLRLAVVSSDLGMSWGGNPFSGSDGWPGGVPPAPCDTTMGDEGHFVVPGAWQVEDVSLDGASIECGATVHVDNPNDQCPLGWVCSTQGNNQLGYCIGPGEGWNAVPCPDVAEPAGWLEVSGGAGGGNMALQVACLSQLGTGGCGWEQQLQAATMALEREDQSSFLREEAALLVLVISDEEDCSMESNGLFSTPEVQDSTLWNVACGENPQYLYSSEAVHQRLVNLKGGNSGAVLFAAIVGVPPLGYGEPVCEGNGSLLGDCLSHPRMQYEMYLDTTTGGGEAWYHKPACERYQGDELVTRASPGRRYVELATRFGAMGVVHSICNPDWTDAMKDVVSAVAAQALAGCLGEALVWDEERHETPCEMLVFYEGQDSCPPPLDWGAEIPVGQGPDPDDGSGVYCVIPKNPAPLECNLVQEEELLHSFGWHYCTNSADATECPFVVDVVGEPDDSFFDQSLVLVCPEN